MIKDTSAQDEVREYSQSWIKRWSKPLMALIALVFISISAFSGLQNWSNMEQSISRDRLRLAEVIKGDFVRDVSVQGRLVAASSPTLYSPTTGIITLEVKAGSKVKAAQLLATIKSPELENQMLQQASFLLKLENQLERQVIDSKKQRLKNQQTVDLAKVRLDAAKREKRRADASIGNNAISLLDFEKSRDDQNTAELQYRHAIEDAELGKESLVFELKTRQLEVDRQKLLVTDMERQLKELSIVSPLEGIVGNLNVDQKQNVVTNQAILTVVDLSEFEVEIQVPESYADDLGLEMKAEINFNNKKLDAVLVAISPEVINNQVSARLRFTDQNISGLKQNQRLSVRVLLEHKANTLTVKRGPFYESGGGKIVYVVTDSLAKKRKVQTGASSIGEIEILGGVRQGETIIISSLEDFQNVETLLLND